MTWQRRVGAAALALSAALGTACAHAGAFDRSLRAGRWQDAATAFRADSALQRNPNALLAAARIHSMPDSATWDPDRALDLFGRARAISPSAVKSESDARAEDLLRYVVRERAARGAEVIVLRDSLAHLGDQADQLRAQLAQLRETETAHASERAVLERMLARLESDVHDRDVQMAALRTELDRLKEIDLARVSHPRP